MVKRKRPAFAGSITVEAVFIIPVVVFVVCTLIIFGFYMEDKAVISEIAGEGAAVGSWLYRRDGGPDTGEYEYSPHRSVFFPLTGPFTAIEDKVRTYVENRLDCPFRLIRRTQVTVRADRDGICVTVSAEAAVPVPGAGLYLGKVRRLQQREDAEPFCPAEFVRRAAAAKGLTESREVTK